MAECVAAFQGIKVERGVGNKLAAGTRLCPQRTVETDVSRCGIVKMTGLIDARRYIVTFRTCDCRRERAPQQVGLMGADTRERR